MRRDAQLAADLSLALDMIEKVPGIDVALKTVRYVRAVLQEPAIESWIPINLPWHQFERNEALCDAGVVVELAGDPPERLLLGDVNKLGGYCNDCPIGRDEIVVRVLDLRGVVEGVQRDVDLAGAGEAA